MGNDKKRLTKIEKESKAKEEQRKAEIATIPPSLSNVPGYGGNRYRPPTPPTPPDWSFWLHMPEVRLWQAVALSMSIDPDSLKHHPQGWMVGPGSGPIFTNDSFSSSEQQIIFDKRLRLLVANKSVNNGFSPGTLSMDHPAYNSVRLSEFSPWAQSIGWDIPAELVASARKHDEKPGVATAQHEVTAMTRTDTPAKVSPGDTENNGPESDTGIPGKIPRTSIGKLAIEAAWLIEQSKSRAATVDEVMAKLQTCADEGSRPEVLLKSEKGKRGVEWRTKDGKSKLYDVEACGKSLAAWTKSRT